MNNKRYIGQSKNTQRRFEDHIYNKSNSLIHRAIKKYGKENFKFEILEYGTLDYDDREKYWIKELNTLHPNGYNLAPGGEHPPNWKGCEANKAMLNEEELCEILNILLPDPLYSINDIAKIFNVRPHVIYGINSGSAYHDDGIKYPIRSGLNWCNEIVFDLLKTQMFSIEEIESMVYLSKNTIENINIGKTYHQIDCEYPILGQKRRIQTKEDEEYLLNHSDILNNIYKDLIDRKQSKKNISKKYNISYTMILKINRGESFHNNNYKYPLRKFDGYYKYLDEYIVQDIIKMLQTPGILKTDISQKYGLTKQMVNMINKGEGHFKREGINYPIREYRKRNI